MVNPWHSYHLFHMNSTPKVNTTDFHMNNYPSEIYDEIETFCKENEFTVDYFLQEFAVNERQIRRPFSAWRGRSMLNDV